MSADNGVYILITKKPPIKIGNTYTMQDGVEYRVAYAQAIDDINQSDLYLPVFWTVGSFI